MDYEQALRYRAEHWHRVMAACGFRPGDYHVQRLGYHGPTGPDWQAIFLQRHDPDYVEPKLVKLLYFGIDVVICLRPEGRRLYVLLAPENAVHPERTLGTVTVKRDDY